MSTVGSILLSPVKYSSNQRIKLQRTCSKRMSNLLSLKRIVHLNSPVIGVVTNLYFLSVLMTSLALILNVSSLVVTCHVLM